MLSKRNNGKTGAESPRDSDPFLWESLEQRLLLSADSVGAVIGDGAVLSILDREQQEDAVDLEALDDIAAGSNEGIVEPGLEVP